MKNYREYILALRKCADEHDKDSTSFGNIRVSDLCRNTAKLLEELNQEPCEDMVSRKELLKTYEDRFIELQKLKHIKENKSLKDEQLGVNWCINTLKDMPPVTPTRKKGKCEFCESGKPLATGKTNDQGIAIHYPNILNAYGYDVHGFGSNGISVKINYCPMCGARMIEPQESEE